jgi:hypothetical protein
MNCDDKLQNRPEYLIVLMNNESLHSNKKRKKKEIKITVGK